MGFCLKIAVKICSKIIMGFAIAMIVYGATMKLTNKEYRLFFGTIDVPIFVIFIGVMILLVSIIGCVGACKGNSLMLIVFGVFTGIVLVLTMAAMITACVISDKVASRIGRNMNRSMFDYDFNNDTKKSWDDIQIEYKCCGTNKSTDWPAVHARMLENAYKYVKDIDAKLYKKIAAYEVINSNTVPDSCCEYKIDICTIADAYEKGCLASLEAVLRYTMITSFGIMIGCTIFIITTIILAFRLAQSVKEGGDSGGGSKGGKSSGASRSNSTRSSSPPASKKSSSPPSSSKK